MLWLSILLVGSFGIDWLFSFLIWFISIGFDIKLLFLSCYKKAFSIIIIIIVIISTPFSVFLILLIIVNHKLVHLHFLFFLIINLEYLRIGTKSTKTKQNQMFWIKRPLLDSFVNTQSLIYSSTFCCTLQRTSSMFFTLRLIIITNSLYSTI